MATAQTTIRTNQLRATYNAMRGSRKFWVNVFRSLDTSDVDMKFVTFDEFRAIRAVQCAYTSGRIHIASKARIALEKMTAYKFMELVVELADNYIWNMDDAAKYLHQKYA